MSRIRLYAIALVIASSANLFGNVANVFCVWCVTIVNRYICVFGKARTFSIRSNLILELGATKVFLFFCAFRIIITLFFITMACKIMAYKREYVIILSPSLTTNLYFFYCAILTRLNSRIISTTKLWPSCYVCQYVVRLYARARVRVCFAWNTIVNFKQIEFRMDINRFLINI